MMKIHAIVTTTMILFIIFVGYLDYKRSKAPCKCKVELTSGEVLIFNDRCPMNNGYGDITHIHGYPLSNIKRFQTIETN